MTSNATVHDLFEPVLTLAELADYLHVPVQTLSDLRAKRRGPRGFRVGRCLHFRKSRLLGHPVVMPRSLLRTYLADSDRELVTPRFGGPRLSLVTRVPTAPYWKSALPTVGRELGLSGVSAHT